MPLISYLRLSRDGRGKRTQDSLGIDAQRAAVAHYAASQGTTIAKEYVEIETGTKVDNRPKLAEAIAHCRRSKATLVIAKLDRLARNVLFTATLLESSVTFVACDNPHANRLTIHILAAIAEDEARRIAERTKAALAARKARGLPLGYHAQQRKTAPSPEARRKGNARSAAIRRQKAHEAYADLRPQVAEWRLGGATLRACAARLNAEGQRTAHGGRWCSAQIYRLLAVV
jgi:DNA invertase Pin-like site-specific DNA recombinase